MNKILDLIFEDVKNENETKKTAVTLRISALIFIGYFLCLMAVFCSMGDWMNVGGCLVCGVCYVLSFYTTYWNHTRESAWISQILMIVWIILFIVMFGWDCGVQHYLFAFLALNFTVSTAGERRKVLNAVGACALRLALYAYARNFEPYSPLDPGISVLIQILNTIFIFAQITAVMIIFTKDAQKMEQKLLLTHLPVFGTAGACGNISVQWSMIMRSEMQALYRSPLQILISLKGSMIPMGMMQVMKC